MGQTRIKSFSNHLLKYEFISFVLMASTLDIRLHVWQICSRSNYMFGTKIFKPNGLNGISYELLVICLRALFSIRTLFLLDLKLKMIALGEIKGKKELYLSKVFFYSLETTSFMKKVLIFYHIPWAFHQKNIGMLSGLFWLRCQIQNVIHITKICMHWPSGHNLTVCFSFSLNFVRIPYRTSADPLSMCIWYDL